MPKTSQYFDSQVSAAASLKLDVYELRDAKAEGCPAFRSGRVYRAPLIEWLKKKRTRRSAPAREEGPVSLCSVPCEWENRRAVIFGIDEFLEHLFSDGSITAETYRALIDKTTPIVLSLGRAWDAGIDEAGYRSRIREIKARCRNAVPRDKAKNETRFAC